MKSGILSGFGVTGCFAGMGWILCAGNVMGQDFKFNSPGFRGGLCIVDQSAPGERNDMVLLDRTGKVLRRVGKDGAGYGYAGYRVVNVGEGEEMRVMEDGKWFRFKGDGEMERVDEDLGPGHEPDVNGMVFFNVEEEGRSGRKRTMTGMKDGEGKVVIEPGLLNLRQNRIGKEGAEGHYFRGGIGYGWRDILNAKGEVVLGGEGRQFDYFTTTGRIPFRLGKNYGRDVPDGEALGFNTEVDGPLWGYMDIAGKVVIEPGFHTASAFHGDVALARRGVEWFLIDGKGEKVADLPGRLRRGGDSGVLYETLVGGLVLLEKEGKTGLYNVAKGKFVIGQEHDRLWWVREPDLLKMVAGGKQGLMDAEGKVLLKPVWDEVGVPSEGLVFVRAGERYGFSDEEGKMVLGPFGKREPGGE